MNASIRDGDWKTKKEGKGDKPGLNICAAGLTTVYEALKKDEWRESDIRERALWLNEKAKNLWKI